MLDPQSGNIIAKRSANYALNFGTRNDSGYECIMNWVKSCVFINRFENADIRFFV